MSDDETWRDCTCQLIDITTHADLVRGKIGLTRGRADGCPVHETEAERAARQQREAAQEAARADYARRYAEAEKAARSV